MIANASHGNGSTVVAKGLGNPLAILLDFFSSVWVGIVWLVLLFVYCSIGSALPAVRQLPGLEMTEFEWFHWWPFDVLVVLFTLSLIVVTLRKIALNWVNAGVWMIHAGIVTLCLGSLIYFGMKEEGDAPVLRRSVKVELPGLDTPVALPALPGAQTTAMVGPDLWKFEIQDTNSEWEIVSDEHKGQKAYSVNVAVRPPTGQPFIRQLLAEYPQYTEDLVSVPGSMPPFQRAIKAVGKKLVNEDLKLSLDYLPTKYFHLQDTWALFVRKVGQTEWVERPIRGMGRYQDRVSSRDQVFSDPKDPLTLRPIDLNVPAVDQADPLAGASVHVTGFLRYARPDRRYREGDRLNPILQITAKALHTEDQTYELIAFDPQRNQVENGAVEFLWLENSAQIESLPTDPSARVTLSVPEFNYKNVIKLTRDSVVGPEGAFTGIEGTPYSYRIRSVQDGLTIPGKDATVSIAMVEFKTPEGQFTRMVADQPEMTRDMHGADADPHSASGREPKAPDARIVATYHPSSAPIMLIAHPGGLHVVVNGREGRVLSRAVTVGESVPVIEGLSLDVNGYWRNAVAEMKPYRVPQTKQQSDAREFYSMVRLDVDTGGQVQSRWLRFVKHALPNESFEAGGSYFFPERFRLADGSWVEVLFSRERRMLSHPIALDDFELKTHVGGYTGSASTIFNYYSKLRFLKNDGSWTEPATISVNDPTGYGGYWYFQSYWDAPRGEAAGTGMNFTGLGIGNRHGVYTQLAGCVIATIGMLYAFYVKPMIKRRRAERAGASSAGAVSQYENVSETETVSVQRV